MRIRKNAKFSQFSTISTPSPSPSPSSNSLMKTHLHCQLNQSPWDIITFPVPNYSDSSDPFQVDEDFGFAGNGSFGDSIGALQSPSESEEVLNNGQKLDFCSDGSRVGFDFDSEGKEEKIMIKKGEEEEDVVLCCETDGKGWQCGRIVKKNGYTHKMCARHLKSCKKSDGTQKRGRGRPPSKKKKPAPAPAGPNENPNEYYYYSGFGPLWGKKKGPGRTSDDDATSMSKNEETNKKILVPEIDYMECDDDDDEEDGGEIGKKRRRKRIKARSLKSLM